MAMEFEVSFWFQITRMIQELPIFGSWSVILRHNGEILWIDSDLQPKKNMFSDVLLENRSLTNMFKL